MKPRIGVLGLGNVLLGDDALGPYAVRVIASRHDFGGGVALEDLGTPGLDLHPHLRDLDFAILVDTVRAEGRPGEVKLYRRDAILRHAPGPRIGPHDPGVKEALLALEFAGEGPAEVLLVGVIPERVGHEVGLSDAVRAALPAVERAVLDELRRLGQPAVPRHPPRPADLWWEREPLAAR